MKIWAGWTLNQRKPEQRADDERAQERQVRLGVGLVEQRDEHERDEGEDERPAGEAVEAVGDVHAVAAAMIANAAKSDVDPRVDHHRADERHRDLVDRVRVLDLERRGDRERRPARAASGGR